MRMALARGAVLSTALLLSCEGALRGEERDANLHKREVMAKHLVFFQEAYGKYRSPAESIYVLMPKLAKREPLSAEEWKMLLIHSVEDSVWGVLPPASPPSGFVQHEQIVDLLVGALQDTVAAQRQYAAKQLTWQVTAKMRNARAHDIQEALGYGPHLCGDESLLVLFAKCGLTPEQRTEIQTWQRVPAMVRALCGNREAEAALVSAFEESEDWQEKRKLARQLAYVGTRKCVEALIDGLHSPVFRDGTADQYSIRAEVLCALGLVYEDEALFTTEAFALNTLYDDVFDRKYGLERYIEAVDHWVQEKFGRSAWGDGEVWFRRLK